MLLYALTKYMAYASWCYLGLLLFTGRPSVLGAMKFGAVRWLLGLAFGLLAAMGLGSVSAQSVASLYFGVYIPLRVVEWWIMVGLISRGRPGQRALFLSIKAWLWVVGGIAISFASDMASPEGMAGRFCVGRCLC